MSLSKLSSSKVRKKLGYLLRRSLQKAHHALEDYSRSLAYDESTQPIVNGKEIRVVGLRRSGNHAIINWIGKQAKGNSIFINHVKPVENPYRNQHENSLLRREKTDNIADWKYRPLDWWEKERRGVFSYKDCLIYSYEDQELGRVAHRAFESKREIYLGKSADRFDVIVMRDPFNLFASRLQTKPREDGPNFDMLEVYSRRYSLSQLWITYAKECLGETSFLSGKKIFINYNKWFLEKSYRETIAAKLGLEFSDEGINDISKSGRGSSFDGDIYAGKAYKMDVLNRWKSYVDNPKYLGLIETEGIMYYSRRLFGDIPGTDVIIN